VILPPAPDGEKTGDTIRPFIVNFDKRLQFLEASAKSFSSDAVTCCKIARNTVNFKHNKLNADTYFFAPKAFELPIKKSVLNEDVCQALKILDKSGDTQTLETFLKQNKSSVRLREWLTGTAKGKRLPALKSSEVIVAEVTFVLFKAIQTASKHLDVYIQGHADDTVAPWQAPLPAAANLELFNKHKPGLLYASLSAPKKKTYKRTYNNDDLPNLRAEFVKNHIVLPLIAVCFEEKQKSIKVGLLSGKLHNVKHDVSKRKTTFYLDFYH
jgi:hypothetical protein